MTEPIAPASMDCPRHGTTPTAYACSHLEVGVACGFHSQTDVADGRHFSWCDACDAARMSVCGSLGTVCAMCAGCWAESRTRNATIPRLLQTKGVRWSEIEHTKIFAALLHQARVAERAVAARWQLHTRQAVLDTAQSHVRFLLRGKPDLVAEARILGRYVQPRGRFEWARSAHTASLLAFGSVRGIEAMTAQRVRSDLAMSWQLTALASYLLGGQMMFSLQDRANTHFMLLDAIREVT